MIKSGFLYEKLVIFASKMLRFQIIFSVLFRTCEVKKIEYLNIKKNVFTFNQRRPKANKQQT
jgi:hypothetical protein